LENENYTRLSTTKAFLHELAIDMGIPITELLQSVQGGDPHLNNAKPANIGTEPAYTDQGIALVSANVKPLSYFGRRQNGILTVIRGYSRQSIKVRRLLFRMVAITWPAF